jgi:hypothetical protein
MPTVVSGLFLHGLTQQQFHCINHLAPVLPLVQTGGTYGPTTYLSQTIFLRRLDRAECLCLDNDGPGKYSAI